jgi:hypothetical protein
VNGVTGPYVVRDPFTPFNVIPAAQIDKVASNVQALIPPPQGPFATQLTQNYNNPFTTQSKQYIPSIKIDHSLSAKIKLSYNWGKTVIATPGPPTNPTAEGFPTLISGLLPSDFETTSNRLNYDQTLAPTLLLHLGGAYVKSSLSMPAAVRDYDPATSLGLKGPFTPLEFPVFAGLAGPNSTGGSNNLGNASGIDGEQLTLEEKTNLIANLTWVKNNHTFKFGGEAGIEGYPNSNFLNTNGVFNFSANETGLPYLNAANPPGTSSTIGLPYASFLLGLPNNYNVSVPAVAKLGKHQLGFYVQDSWKVTRKVTLDLGLRYDYSTAGKEQYGRYGFFDPTVANTQAGGHPGGVTYGATCGCGNNFFDTYKLGFGPRLGVAYQLTEKTVLRAGVSLLIGTTADNGIQTRSVTSVNQVPSTAFAQSPLANGLAGGIPLTFAQIAWPNFDPSHFPVVNPATPGAPGSAPGQWIDRHAGYPSKSYQWSFGVQREIARSLVVDVYYVGNRGVWLPSSGAINYNANTVQSLLAAGLDITNPTDQAILKAQIGSSAAGRFQNKLPYPGFPLTSTVAQSLRPFPQFTNAPTALWAPLGDNWYNSLQIRVTKRLSHGLDLSYNFTWSKTLTNGIEGQENDINNRNLNKFLSNLDRPMVSNLSITYTVPAAAWAGNKVLRSVLRDWTTGALLTYASGAPILVPSSTNFNPTAWSNPSVGTYSTSAAYYNDYRSQRHPTENFNIGRTFRIRESMSLSLRAEYVNMFNRTVLPAPSTLTSPLTAPTCFVSGVSGTTGPCTTPGAAYASGFGTMATLNQTLGTRTGQIVARFRF